MTWTTSTRRRLACSRIRATRLRPVGRRSDSIRPRRKGRAWRTVTTINTANTGAHRAPGTHVAGRERESEKGTFPATRPFFFYSEGPLPPPRPCTPLPPCRPTQRRSRIITPQCWTSRARTSHSRRVVGLPKRATNHSKAPRKPRFRRSSCVFASCSAHIRGTKRVAQ